MKGALDFSNYALFSSISNFSISSEILNLMNSTTTQHLPKEAIIPDFSN
jgi:hypothetical protein